ncbi:hypothetical protein GCM10023313_12030 [Mucilaginibacter defluvii]|uniref:Nephrocystin 3-like N-terminal domain-containing protein n=1 Tax=Mucilaginibacter defluvii TaxID=1196019 RepID=A0ABP9FQ08_9SPHI
MEGSKDKGKAGEYVIDLAEYYGDEAKISGITYYQLKHTTTQKDDPFIISGLKETFVGFGKKFQERKQAGDIGHQDIRFAIVTNRPIDPAFKSRIKELTQDTCKDKKFINTIRRYTGLDPVDLAVFCSILSLDDTQGDYNLQKAELRVELFRLLAGPVDNAQLSSLTTIISDKALPDSDGLLLREEVLKCFGFSSESELFPAKPVWEPPTPVIGRDSYQELADQLMSSGAPVLIHAPGGVGKSVFTRYMIEHIKEGSEIIAYDCFGAGSYRNRSRSRHRHKDALVQMANELAAKGLCDPLLVTNGTQEAEITRAFIKRLETSAVAIKSAYPDGSLLLLIDAADNAEMAAKEMNDSCFAAELLKERMPVGVRIAFLCRTERISYLRPESYVVQLPLQPFTLTETHRNLQLHYPMATIEEAEEFHRLTAASPRVQANALATGVPSISVLLADLGPAVMTVEAQIAQQLEQALGRLKDSLPPEHHPQLEKICVGLASLSPNIPIAILAEVANVDPAAIKSFVSDIGRSLWLADDSVQFRDEPTETWFRQKFSADPQDLEQFILTLEPLTEGSVYAAQMLPQLYHQAERYEKLIEIALSDDFLPKDNPIDERNIRFYRLQFALKASLKIKDLKAACKIALRAGEETAGNQRQVALLKRNIDLLVRLQSKEKIQEMAMRRELSGAWEGSANIYSASLLSDIADFRGEARSFLRSAQSWLKIYFNTPRDPEEREQRLQDHDILELAFASLNINGVEGCARVFERLSPVDKLAKILGRLIRRLIDAGDHQRIEELTGKCRKEPLYLLAINNELAQVGKFCNKKIIQSLLTKLNQKKYKPSSSVDSYHEEPDLTIVALAEACLFHQLPKDKIGTLIQKFFSKIATYYITQSYHLTHAVHYFRSIAIHCLLNGSDLSDIAVYLPAKRQDKKSSHEEERELTNYKELISGALPWYLTRLEVIVNGGNIIPARLEEIAKISSNGSGQRYRYEDPLPGILSVAYLEILKFSGNSGHKEILGLFDARIRTNRVIGTRAWIDTARWAHRLAHLSFLSDDLEDIAYQHIRSQTNESPEELSQNYVSLARAVGITSTDNAGVYFDDAIAILSKFGDEMVRRWEAVTEIAKRAAEPQVPKHDYAYRFIRVAELVGLDRREKHWDRDEAIQVTASLSPNGGIAALSRWRDRDIGRFDWLINAALIELTRSGGWSPVQAWSYHPFCSPGSFPYLLKGVLRAAHISPADKKVILKDSIRHLKRQLNSASYWTDLQELADEQGLADAELKAIVSSLPAKLTGAKKREEVVSAGLPGLDWDAVFAGHDILTPEGITRVDQAIRQKAVEHQFHYGRQILQVNLIQRTADPDLVSLVNALLQCDWIEHYDLEYFFKCLPERAANRPGFVKQLPQLVAGIGRRFALELTSYHSFRNMVKVLPGALQVSDWLKEGIFQGMINDHVEADAEHLFDMVGLAGGLLTPADALETLDYALSRFEIHIEETFGDGPWAAWLETGPGTGEGMAGFLWSALASPRSDHRWRAAHTLLNLANFNEQQVFHDLFDLAEKRTVGAYGCSRYPFYFYHGLQYLMIAISRVATEKPYLLKMLASKIADYATGLEHATIQKTASETALRIASACPGTFSDQEIAFFEKIIRAEWHPVDLTPLWDPIPKTDDDGDSEEAFGYYFGYDFSRYWLGDLGRYFGLTQKQMVDLSGHVVVNEWGTTSYRFDADPRAELWNKYREDYSVGHSHGSYPRDDNHNFYISYHAMMVVVSRLLSLSQATPAEDGSVKSLSGWLAKHSITRRDGYWIADWKDPLPLKRPVWPEKDHRVWQSTINAGEMVPDLLLKNGGDVFLTIAGDWEEASDIRRETYRVRSALVSPATANALMCALATCEDHHDFKIPDHKERDMEFRKPPFKLKGWIRDKHLSARLDEYDPFAKELPFPPFRLGKHFIEKLGLLTSKDHKTYFKKDKPDRKVMFAEQWSSGKEDSDHEVEQTGSRLNCSLDLLAEVCGVLQMDIIFKVEVSRNLAHRYRSDDTIKYQPSIHQIFILSADGVLRDTERSYVLRDIAR